MTVRKRSIKSDLARVDAHRITKAEYDEAPELTQEMLDRAEIRHGDRIIKRGRPPLENPKEAVKLRLDHDVLAAYRKTGSGGKRASMPTCERPRVSWRADQISPVF